MTFFNDYQIDFVKKLINITLDNKIKWNMLDNLKSVSESENYSLYYTLFTNEYHKISYERSYYTSYKDGNIYLIYEWSESGKDGSISEGYNLYTQFNKNEPVDPVFVDKSYLYQLSNAIKEDIKVKNNTQHDFIKSFLEEA